MAERDATDRSNRCSSADRSPPRTALDVGSGRGDAHRLTMFDHGAVARGVGREAVRLLLEGDEFPPQVSHLRHAPVQVGHSTVEHPEHVVAGSFRPFPKAQDSEISGSDRPRRCAVLMKRRRSTSSSENSR